MTTTTGALSHFEGPLFTHPQLQHHRERLLTSPTGADLVARLDKVDVNVDILENKVFDEKYGKQHLGAFSRADHSVTARQSVLNPKAADTVEHTLTLAHEGQHLNDWPEKQGFAKTMRDELIVPQRHALEGIKAKLEGKSFQHGLDRFHLGEEAKAFALEQKIAAELKVTDFKAKSMPGNPDDFVRWAREGKDEIAKSYAIVADVKNKQAMTKVVNTWASVGIAAAAAGFLYLTFKD